MTHRRHSRHYYGLDFRVNVIDKFQVGSCSSRSGGDAKAWHLAPCTLHPATCTLHPAPHTLHPTPYTLHPTPCTPHPTPCTPHPTPYTRHLTPRTLHPTIYTNLLPPFALQVMNDYRGAVDAAKAEYKWLQDKFPGTGVPRS